MKKILLSILAAFTLMACGQNKTTESKATSQPAITDTTTAANPISDDGFIIIPNKTNSGGMTKEENTNVKTAYEKGVQYYQQGESQKAIDEFNFVLKYYPEHPQVLYYLGKLYYDLKQYDNSLSFYKKALQNNISDSLSTLAIGQIYFEQKDLTKAMEYYNMAIDGAPGYGLAYYDRGTLLGMQNQYQEALIDLNKSIELDQTNPNAYLNRGLAYFYLKQLDKACEDWLKAADMGLAEGKKAVDIYCKK